MAEQKQKFIKFTTPKGIARFPSLNAPDTKFNPAGEYKTGLILSAEAAAPYCKMIEDEANKALEAARAELTEKVATEKGEKKAKAAKALKELALGDLPFKPMYDEDGNETGDVVLTFKMKASRKDKKTGIVTPMTPRLFDAAGNPIKKAKPIWGGSTLRVSGTINPFYIPGTNLAGVSLRLGGVQIIELRSADGGNASSYGFGKEDGYTVSEDDDEVPAGNADQDEPEGDDEF